MFTLADLAMWEAIERNKRRSWILIGVMGLILAALGYVIGAFIYLQLFPFIETYQSGISVEGHITKLATAQQESQRPSAIDWSEHLLNSGGFVGVGVALTIWLIMTIVSLLGGDRVLLRTARAYPISQEAAPQLWNVVEEMTIASSLGAMPRVYIIEDESPNAFAVGRNPDSASVAVTSGLLKRLNRDELQGVIAHEIGHVKNLDVRFMTLAAMMVGSIVVLSEFFLRYLWYGGGRRSSSSRKAGGQAMIVLLIVGIAAALLAPLAARMLYFACSRRREYLADASAAVFTRYPDGLASALETISAHSFTRKNVSRAMAPLYIFNPLQTRHAVGLFSTHPPTLERINILRSMGGRAGLADYEQAYRKVHGQKSRCLDAGTVNDSESISAREPTAEPKSSKAEAIARAKEVLGVLDRAVNIIPILCVCGVTLKIPPLFGHKKLRCPRCGKHHDVPAAQQEKSTKPQQKKPQQIISFKRKGGGWESFKCVCGAVIQLSPKFRAKFTSCRKCSRDIKIT